MSLRRKRNIPPPTASLLRRVQQGATNKYNSLKDSHLSNLTNYRWMRYVIVLWTFRMVFVAIGFLFLLLSLLSSSHSEESSFEMQTTDWNKSNATFTRSLISKEVPFLFKHASVPDSSVVGYLLLSYMPAIISNIKQSSTGHYVYYSSDQQWSDNISNTVGYDIIERNKEDFMSQLSHPTTSDQPKQHLYFSQILRNPSSHPILLNLAPQLLDLPPSTKGVTPEFRLWLSSENSTVGPHYDMEHNFFMQVNGTKTFLIGAPALSKLFRPHSTLHPHWRQGQQSHLTGVDEVYRHALTVTSSSTCDREGNLSTTGIQKVSVSRNVKALHWGATCRAAFTVSRQPRQYTNRKKKITDKVVDLAESEEGTDDDSSDSKDRKECDSFTASSSASAADTTDTDTDTTDTDRTSDSISTGTSGSLYEVTLHPGDVLYIPPFYFHAVTSHLHSVSLNTWVGSRYLVASAALKNVDLPYRDRSSALVQVSALAAMVKATWLKLNSPIGMQYFAALMHDRHQDTSFDSTSTSTSGGAVSKATHCSAEGVQGSSNGCVWPDAAGVPTGEQQQQQPQHEHRAASPPPAQLLPCTLRSLKRAEQERIVSRAASSVSNILAEFPLSIQTAILMDYVDDIFDLISGPEESSPRNMREFIGTCLDVQQYF